MSNICILFSPARLPGTSPQMPNQEMFPACQGEARSLQLTRILMAIILSGLVMSYELTPPSAEG
jgi:hypothetical protein